MDESRDGQLKTTPLHALHGELGARMVPFGGYHMPVQFDGIIAEHLHTRARASLFDVSHMGQAFLSGDGAAAFLETLVPADMIGLKPGRVRYTMFTNEAAGILDDLMVSNLGERLYLVVNAACKDADFARIQDSMGGGGRLEVLADRALLAVQGPAAAGVLQELDPAAAAVAFMSVRETDLDGIPCLMTRSGYTGEDGFEISAPAAEAERLARRLLEAPEVRPAGLGARDSLRLEAGLCLYGSDIDETTTPVEADLAWTIGQRRRAEGGFPGDRIVQAQLSGGVSRRRVGLRPTGKAPARAHTQVTDETGAVIGEVTSGGYGPSVGGPVAMGYVAQGHQTPDTGVNFIVRGKAVPGRVQALPFTEHRYFKK